MHLAPKIVLLNHSSKLPSTDEPGGASTVPRMRQDADMEEPHPGLGALFLVPGKCQHSLGLERHQPQSLALPLGIWNSGNFLQQVNSLTPSQKASPLRAPPPPLPNATTHFSPDGGEQQVLQPPPCSRRPLSNFVGLACFPLSPGHVGRVQANWQGCSTHKRTPHHAACSPAGGQRAQLAL